jgi:hypothetical protein
MIPASDHLEQRSVYSRNKSGFWKIVAFCEEPTVTMENMATGQRETFGISGAAADAYIEIGQLPLDFQLHGDDIAAIRSTRKAISRLGQ